MGCHKNETASSPLPFPALPPPTLIGDNLPQHAARQISTLLAIMPRPKKELDPQLRSRICELYSIGWGPKKIHDKYREIPYGTIRTTINRERQRLNNETRPRPGRPHKLSEEQRDHLFELSTTSPHLKYVDLLDKVDHTVKKRSIQRLLNEMGRRKWKQQNRPELSPIHALKRLQWAQEYQHFTPGDWARVKWSDECTVERGIGVKPIWTFTRPHDQLYEKDIHAIPCGKGIKQMFWAAFGERMRTGLVPLDGDPGSRRGGVTGDIINILYQSFLPDLLQPGDIFMHDNAPVHTTGAVQATLDELGVEVMIWPPHSPDLNPIENLWALMKQKIYQLYPELEHAPNKTASKELLIKAAKEAWNSLEDRILVRLSETMPNRVRAVIEADGWYTKY